MAVRKAEGRHMGRKEGNGPKKNYLNSLKEETLAKLTSGIGILALCKDLGIKYETFRQFRKKYLNMDDDTE